MQRAGQPKALFILITPSDRPFLPFPPSVLPTFPPSGPRVQVLVWKEINYSHMRPVEKQRIADEVNILKELRNPFIVRFYDHIHERASKRCYIVMEHCPVRTWVHTTK